VGVSMAAASPVPHAAATTPVKFILGWIVEPEYAGFYAAQSLGYYKQMGLDVTIVPGGPNVNTEQLIGAGSGQFGDDAYDNVLTSNDAGTDLLSLAQILTRPGLRLISLKSSHLSNPASWKGKTIGVFSSDNPLYATLNKYHINATTGVKQVQQGANMSQFLSGQLDLASAYVFDEVGQVVAGGVPYSKLNQYNFASDGTATLEDQIFGNGAYVKAHPAVAAKFVAASLKGWIYCRDHAAACVTLTSKAGSTFPKSFGLWSMNEVNQLIWPVSKGIGYLDPAQFNNSAHILFSNKVIKKMPIVANYMDTSVYNAALKLMGNASLTGDSFKPLPGLKP
jgi:NitT/TauT family transport system substrate-binding protein